MPEHITCLGEALVDLVRLPRGKVPWGYLARPGGSLLNTAVALRRLGQRAAFAGKLGNDFFGRRLRDHLAAEGLDGPFVGEARAPTALAFVDLSAGEPAFAFYGERTADGLLAAEDLPDALLDETRALHVGSLGLLRGRARSAAVYAIQRLRGRALVSVDPNIRPTLISDAEEHRAFLAQLFTHADLVKASAADLAWLAPRVPAERAAAEILASGPALVVVTLGEEGAFALRRATGADQPSPVRVPGFAVSVADTVGAGDAFTAGLLAHLAERGSLAREAALALGDGAMRAALRFATATAALCCTRQGADPPHREQVAAFLAERPAPAQ